MAMYVYPFRLYLLYSHLKWKVIVADFRRNTLIQQYVFHLQIISKDAGCHSSVQELNSSCNTNSNSHSLWPFEPVLLSPICHITTEFHQNCSSFNIFLMNRICDVRKLLPVRWSLKDPFEMFSRTMNTVVAVLGGS